jgi:hypothetical protein
MGVHWSANRLRWKPHISRDGTQHTLSHLHPFRFVVELPEGKGHPARTVSVQVGFSTHTFTCDVKDAPAGHELYDYDREQRAFDFERYGWSKKLRDITKGLERRKCYVAKREAFVTVEMTGVPTGLEYRVFFKTRKAGTAEIDLIVQSAYLGPKEFRPYGQTRQPIGFRVIVSRTLLGKK